MSLMLFQSTFPRGERRHRDSLSMILQNFNPRSRVGNDPVEVDDNTLEVIFQSTFPRGERPVSHTGLIAYMNFNPRSRVGNDRSDHVYGLRPYDISIHVPAWGTTEKEVELREQKIFQSTFPRGDRLPAWIHWTS